MTDKPTLPRPPTVNVLPAEDERDEGACDLEDNNTLRERAESSASIGGTNVDEDFEKESSVFRRFGTQSRINLEQKVLEWDEEEKERKNQHEEGRLVDGELIFGNDEGSKDPPPDRDLALFEGNTLPDQYGNLFPEDGYGVPMEEIDPFLHYRTFIVIAKRFKRNTIFRFSATNSFFIFSPWNPFRRLAVYIATNQYFDYFVMMTILVNCVFLALNENQTTKIAEYVFLAIYTLEAIIKLTARGFFVHRFTYLRDGWNWLDFLVIVSAYLTIILESLNLLDIGSLAGLRTFRVFRILKTVSIVPDLKTIIGALLKSMRMIIEVIILISFCMVVFALFGLQVYLGVLRQKCVKDPIYPISHGDYDLHIKNSSNWYIDQQGQYFICGNISSAGACPSNHTCLPDIGENPNWGYTNFDHFGWSMLNSLQLITLDFWEDPYNKVIHANGPWNIVFFIFVVFFGSFYLVNLMLAVVSMAYEEEAKNAGKEKERENEKEKSKMSAADETIGNSAQKNDEESDEKDQSGNGPEKDQPPSNSKPEDDDLHTEKSAKEKRKERMKNQGTMDSGMGSDDKLDKADNNENKCNKTDGEKKKSNTQKIPKVKIRDVDSDDELLDRNCECCSTCCCSNFITWLRIQNFLFKIVSDVIFEIFITVCILTNTLIMALEHHEMNNHYVITLKVSNYIFTSIFLAEALLKLFAYSKVYFKSAWNLFDAVVVIASIIDLGLESVKGLSLIRTFRLLRLLRVFKLAQTWQTMRMLLQIILSTLGALGHLTLILCIVIYIFAVIGMQLFRDSYSPSKFYPDDKPRWNFDDFGHSIILVFRILCGEWIEPLWDCMRAAGQTCMVVFMPTLILGNFMVLSLFLALLLNSFASDSLKRDQDVKEDSRVKQGWKRIQSLFKKKSVEPDNKPKKLSVADIAQVLKQNQLSKSSDKLNAADSSSMSNLVPSVSVTNVDETSKTKPKQNGEVTPTSDFDTSQPQSSPANGSVHQDNEEMKNTKNKLFLSLQKNKSENSNDSENTDAKSGSTPRSIFEIEEERRRTELEEEEQDKAIQDCCPAICYSKIKLCNTFQDSKWGPKWDRMRKVCFMITENKVFEYAILFIIFASSISLCFEDIYLDDPDRKQLKDALYYLNIIFVVIFSIEMLLKWVAIGFKKYFSSFWTLLDFAIVVISIISLAADSIGAASISSLKSLRTLRALRPLRAISRWQGMRIVVNALMYAIPSIFNVLLVCLIFWLVFSIAGVQLLGGKFYRCIDADGVKIGNISYIPDKKTCLAEGLRWKNAPLHFDNVLHGYLALFQVATFEGWMEIMEDAVDATDIDLQPIRENNLGYYAYFVIFILVGSFFTLNLFIGVIIDNFNMLKKKYEGSYLDMFLTSSQKNYMNTMKKLGNKKPQKTIKRPKHKIQAFIFDVAISTKFELAVVVLILLNMLCMAIEHYKQPQAVTDALEVINLIFVTIFTLEAAVKIFGLRWHYFRRAWNVFDFIIVVLSIVGVVLSDVLRSVFINPTLLRVVRVFRIGRVLRLIKVAKGIRKLLFALVISLPALFNIFMLLFLIMFIYAIFGMSQFGKIKHADHIDDIMNFQTFPNALLLLFRLTTAAGWNDVLYPMLVSDAPDCNNTHWQRPDGRWEKTSGGNCSNSFVAIAFMVSYIFITYLIIINMYIAIILENFHQAHDQEEVGITEDDFDMFYMVWEKYDPHATQFIKYEHLSDFVGDLDPPLGISKPNEIALVSFDLPIVEGDRLHCLDILIALVRHVLGEVEVTNEFQQLKQQMESKFKEQFPTRVQFLQTTTTMRRKKEDVAARTLQRAWKKHKAEVSIRRITQMAMDQKNKSLTRSSSIWSQRRDSQASQTGSFAIAQRRASKLSNRLKVPTADTSISLPSEKNEDDL